MPVTKVHSKWNSGNLVFHDGAGTNLFSIESDGTIDIKVAEKFKLAGTAVTATAAEINKLAGVTAGTAAASKALVLGANKNIDTIVVANGGLKLGSGSGTAVTATAAELNALDSAPLGAAITVGTETANVINVAVQLQDANGVNLAVRGSVMAYLSDDANGDSLVATAPSGGVVIGTNGLAIPLVAGKAFQLVSEANGALDLNITETGAKTCYLVLVLPNGKLAASGAITFAA